MSFPGTPGGMRTACHFIITLPASIQVYLKNFTHSETLSTPHMTRISYSIIVRYLSEKGIVIRQFLADCGSADQCQDALFSWCWPDGCQCPKCYSFRSFCQLCWKAEFQSNCLPAMPSLTQQSCIWLTGFWVSISSARQHDSE